MKTKFLFYALLIILFTQGCNKPDEEDEKGAATGCECVGYVKNVLNITRDTADAHLWGNSYQIPNHYEVSEPQIGDIVVMTRGYSWASDTAGHIGFVKSISYNGNLLNIMCHGSNQQSNTNTRGEFNECGCYNVDDLEIKNITQSDRTSKKIKFYRATQANYCETFSVRSQLIVTPSSLSFGAVNMNESKSLNLELKNSGPTAININQITIPSYFSTNQTNLSIPSNQTKNITVKFSPTQVGSFSSNISFSSNAINSTVNLPVQGSGVTVVPQFSISSTPLAGTYVSCPGVSSYNGTGNCSSFNFNTGIIKVRLKNSAVEDGQLVFEIAKCDGSNFMTGKAYIKKGNECGTPIPANGISYNGGKTITIKVPIDFWGLQNFTCVLIPDNFPPNFRYMGGTIWVTRN